MLYANVFLECCISGSITIKLCHNSHYPADHDDVIQWRHFPRYWPFVRGIHRSPVNSPHKGQWRGALMFPLICARINDWVNNGEAGDLRRNRVHYDVIVMCQGCLLATDINWDKVMDKYLQPWLSFKCNYPSMLSFKRWSFFGLLIISHCFMYYD